MSMIGNLLRVSNSELQSYLQNSALLEERVYPEEYVEDPAHLDLDKSWESIYFLLTGCTTANAEEAQPPLSLILFNGGVIDEEQDMGYGAATYATSEQVKEIEKALPNLAKEQIRIKFATLESTNSELYSFDPDSEEMFDYLLEHYKSMKEFYSVASKNDQAVISFIN